MAMTNDLSADGDQQQLSTNNVICLSVNSLVQQELESHSELADEIKIHIGIHGVIPSVKAKLYSMKLSYILQDEFCRVWYSQY